MTGHSKRELWSWCLYDWANSPFPTVILTFITAVYFTEHVATNTMLGTAQWGYMVAISGLVIAILSPSLGAISDLQQRRKPWTILFTIFAIIASALLWFATPVSASTPWLLGCVGIGLVSTEVAMVFYNAMLKDLAPPGYIGRLSGWAWGLGYAGGLSCLVVLLWGFVSNPPTWLNTSAQHLEQVRISGPIVALWFAIFSIPFILWTKDITSSHQPTLNKALTLGMKELGHTLRALKHHKHILLFLIAHLLYIDGLNTIISFGGIYAAGTFGMQMTDIIIFGIATNVAAGIGAFGFGWLDDSIGPKQTILIALSLMMLTGTGMLTTTSTPLFWALAMGLSLCVGPVQAASRSLMAHIAPEHMASQLFGLFALSGKITTFLGPWILAWATLHFQSQRLGISTSIYFLIVGAILLAAVKVPKE